MKTRSLNLSASFAKRTEEARRAQIRADNMLNKRLHEAGGLEDLKRMQFENIRREQINLRHQLEVIKHKKQTEDESTDDESDIMEENNLETKKVPKKAYAYGRNYFGYKSSPGSNKSVFASNKSTTYRRKDVGTKYSPKIVTDAEKEVHRKLKQERTKYREFQDKAKTFGKQEWKITPPTQSMGTSLKHIDVKGAKEAVSDRLLTKKQSEDRITYKSNPQRKRSIVIPSSQFPPFTELPKTLYTAGIPDLEMNDSTSIKSKQTTSSLFQSTPSKNKNNGKVQTALDLVFDEELYAPDGRIRMMHRLPDFKESLREAKSARYTRTKYKREIEQELTVDEIFSPFQKPTTTNGSFGSVS